MKSGNRGKKGQACFHVSDGKGKRCLSPFSQGKMISRAALFLVCAVIISGCAGFYQQPQAPVAPRTIDNSPLGFKPVIKYTVTFFYTPKDPGLGRDSVIQAFSDRLAQDGNGGYGYETAEGVAPDLYVNLYLYNDGSDDLKMAYVVYGNSPRLHAVNTATGGPGDYAFYYCTLYSYRDANKMIQDTADYLNGAFATGTTQTYNGVGLNPPNSYPQ
jgi:hypothetical protein